MTVQETKKAMEAAGAIVEAETDVSRRGFIAGSGLLFGVAVTAGSSVTLFDAHAASRFAPRAWVSIGTDDTVTIVAPAGEMGQGVYTSMPIAVGSEYWSHVTVTSRA